jgi:DNA invertase Pin-like site-specific DNA recombinase
VAQFETEVRKERQLNGIAAARAANGGKCPWGGRQQGTRITLTEEKEVLARKLKAEGQSVASIARNLGIARKTVYVALKRGAVGQ